jgi:hypothetical protein
MRQSSVTWCSAVRMLMQYGLAGICCLAIAAPLVAQQPIDSMPGFVRHEGWDASIWVIEGTRSLAKESLTLGGAAETKMRLVPRLGDHFQVQIIFSYEGTMPVLRYGPRGSLARGGWQQFSLSGVSGRPIELLLTGSDRGFMSGQSLQHNTRTLDGSSSSGGNLYAGNRVAELALVVPAGSKMTITSVLVKTTSVSEESSPLIAALIVLALILVGMMALGWLLQRRRQRSATPGIVQGIE